MIAAILKIYDYLRNRKFVWWLLLAVSVAALVARTFSLSYKEDIYDFLPVDENYRQSLSIYQNISAADKIFVIFRMRDGSVDQQYLSDAVDLFAERLTAADSLGMVGTLTSEIDYEQFMESADEIYGNIPYFLAEEDYARLDSLLTHDYVAEQIRQDKTLLMLPTGSLLSQNIRKDPLNIFTPTVAKLQNMQSGMNYDLYDGHIFSPDRKMAITIVATPFGSSETAQNTKLLKLIDEAIARTEVEMPDADGHATGAPAIAVGNASQIKRDSIVAVALALVLILALLYYTFRNLSSILLIVVSIGWGALFAMAGISLIHSNISVIVLGIASVIMGIAVNYPLHLIAHLKHTSTVRETLREIIMPLLIGNITTVGAFLCLVPLEATALQDLGIFGAFVLVGTIIFVLIFLPHMVKNRELGSGKQLFTERLSDFAPESKRGIVAVAAVVTIILGWFSLRTSFDTDMQHINYMTDAQKEDFASLQTMMNEQAGSTTLYIVSQDATLDGAVRKSELIQPALEQMSESGLISGRKSITAFIPSAEEQRHRLELWYRLLEEKRDVLGGTLERELAANGFNVEAFDSFRRILNRQYEVDENRIDSSPLLSTLAGGYVSRGDSFSVVDMVSVSEGSLEAAKAYVAENMPTAGCFNIKEMNSVITNTLSDEFNYIGFSCGLIVFLFLWLSFGRLELSLLAFLPMMISWVWILGLMGLMDIRFNIVNIILATFIFGQGDDYTIFMTEGLIYEYAYRKKMLASYKNSIIVSALIMFIGIGTLIVAKHPALRSLAEVTIVGMFSVVFTAYFIPPLIFKFLTARRGEPRQTPLTLERIGVAAYFALMLAAECIVGAAVMPFGRRALRRYVCRCARFNSRILAGVDVRYANLGALRSDLPSVCNRRSWLDTMLLLGLNERVKIAELAESTVGRLLGYDDMEGGIVIYDADKWPDGSQVQPLYIHGSDMVVTGDSCVPCRGKITVEAGETIAVRTPQQAAEEYDCRLAAIGRREQTAGYYEYFVRSRYFYKGFDVERHAARLLKRYGCFSRWVDAQTEGERIVVLNNGYGVLGLLMALVHKDKEVCAYECDEEHLAIAQNCSPLPANLHIRPESEFDAGNHSADAIYILNPTAEQTARYGSTRMIRIE